MDLLWSVYLPRVCERMFYGLSICPVCVCVCERGVTPYMDPEHQVLCVCA